MSQSGKIIWRPGHCTTWLFSYRRPRKSGAKADLIAVDLDSFHMGAVDDPIRTIFLCGSGADVKLSVINGRTVMKDQQIEGVDLEEIKAKGQIYYNKMKLGYMERDYQHLPAEKLFRPSFPMR